jgi:hypothetical protein
MGVTADNNHGGNPADRGSYVKPPIRHRCRVCGRRIVIDLAGGADCWVHLSELANADHWAER